MTAALPSETSLDAAELPPDILEELHAYYISRQRPCEFLCMILANQPIMNSLGHADDAQFAALKAVCHYIHWVLPGCCHGSQEKVETWLKENKS